jgi:hypothetical protein
LFGREINRIADGRRAPGGPSLVVKDSRNEPEATMTAYSHSPQRRTLPASASTHTRRPPSARRGLHPRTLLAAFLVAVAIVVAISFAFHSGTDQASADAHSDYVPAGIWISPSGGPLK